MPHEHPAPGCLSACLSGLPVGPARDAMALPYVGQTVVVVAVRETEVEVNAALADPHVAVWVGVLMLKVAPLAPPPAVVVELVTELVSKKRVALSVPPAPFAGSVITAKAKMGPQNEPVSTSNLPRSDACSV